MGSPAEQRAMQFAVDKFREFGCLEAYVMPFTVAEGVNTKSGIAIGVLRGRTDRIIIVGGHIDSSGPDVPGANDDGSGVACVLELARVFAKRPHESTIMFCCWGGEERGELGSKYFVEQFSKLDSVMLMLQIDMADGASVLEIDPDYQDLSAPRWLTEAAFDIFYNELHSQGLVYPVASATLNAASGGATGSDHNQFLKKGIPAVDFTSDVDYPIHTPLDNLANFTPSGLKRSGDLVLKLVERFDGGIPARTVGHYMLVQFGTTPIFLPHWFLWSVIVVAILFSVTAIVVLWRRRVRVEGVVRVRWSGIKVILLTLIVQSFIWLSESLFGFIDGNRFPWVSHFPAFVLLGILSGLLGLWLTLRMLGRFPLSSEAYGFGGRALTILAILTLLSAFTGPKLAAFFALATILMSLALMLRSGVLRVALWVLSCLVLLRLVFFEEMGLIQRLLAENLIHSFGGVMAYEAVFIVFCTLISLPFVFGFAAIYRASGIDLFWLKKLRARRHFLAVPVAALGVMVYLFMQRPYDRKWHSRIQVEQKYAMGADSSTITIRGSEYLNGLKMVADSQEVPFCRQTNFFEFHPSHSSVVPWCSVDAHFWPAKKARDQDSMWSMDRRVTIHSQIRPYRVSVRYSCASPFEVSSPWAYRDSERSGKASDNVRIFSWYSFPDTLIDIPITFALGDSQRVSEKIEVTFDTLAYPLHLNKDLTYFELSTVVSEAHEFGVRNDSTNIVSPPQ